MFSALRKLLLPLLTGLALLALLTVGAAVLLLYREAATLHPWAGVAVLAVAALAVALLLVAPVAAVLRLPASLRPVAPHEPGWERYLRRYARRLRDNPVLEQRWEGRHRLDRALREGVDADRLLPEIREAVAVLDEEARRRIRERAALVFALTAVSQSGRLDTFVVLAAQLRLVRDLAILYLQRPTLVDLARLYANVGASAFVAGEIQDSEILAVLGAPVGAAVTNLVPLQGTDPLVSLLVTSLMDGSANGFLTLRIGALARRHCQPAPEPAALLARSASLEAAALLGGAVSDGATRVARAVRKLVVRGAVEGTGRAARGIAGAGAGAVGRVAGVVDRTARDLGRRMGAPPRRILEQALRFWEGVARDSAPGAGGSGG